VAGDPTIVCTTDYAASAANKQSASITAIGCNLPRYWLSHNNQKVIGRKGRLYNRKHVSQKH
jgi:hypothetical protein